MATMPEKAKKHRRELVNELTLIVKNELPLAVSIAKDNPSWYDVQKYGHQISEMSERITALNWIIGCAEKE